MWRGGSVLEDSNTGGLCSGVISRIQTTAAAVASGLPRSGQGTELGSRRDKQLRVGPVMLPALTFYPQMRT